MFAKFFAKKSQELTRYIDLPDQYHNFEPSGFIDWDEHWAQCRSEEDEFQDELDELIDNEGPKQIELKENLVEAPFIPNSTVADVLQQRLVVYQNELAKAEKEGNSSKARRMVRIIKRFQDALKLVNAGESICLDHYPNPPPHALIPVPHYIPSLSTLAALQVHKLAYFLWTRNKELKAAALTSIKNNHLQQANEILRSAKPYEKLLNKLQATKPICMLLANQSTEFHTTILGATNSEEELTRAREYFQKYGDFDQLINNVYETEQADVKEEDVFDKLVNDAHNRLKIELVPLSLQPSHQSECDEKHNPLMEETLKLYPEPFKLDMLSKLEEALTKQLKFTLTILENHEITGCRSAIDSFEKLALKVTENLNSIIQTKQASNPQVPKFHYESLQYYTFKFNPDLQANELELTIIRGLDYACNPQYLDTYVEFHFQNSKLACGTKRGHVYRNSNNPEYHETFVLHYPRQCSPKNGESLKVDIMTRSGFFRKDTLLGSATLRFDALRSQCEIHECLTLTNGNDKFVGKLEVQMRVQKSERLGPKDYFTKLWLVIDN